MRPSTPKVSYVHFNTAGCWLFSKYAFALKSAGAEVEIASVDEPSDQAVAGYYDHLVPTTVLGHCPPITATFKPLKELQRIRGKFVRRAALRRLKRHLTNARPSHLIAGDPFALAVCAPLSQRLQARLTYIPFEFYPQHVGANRRQANRFEACERRHIAEASAVVFLGDAILEYYKQEYPGIAARGHVVYSSWPLCRSQVDLQLRKAVKAGSDKRIILYQGIIELDRGLINVIRALKDLPADTLFAVVGYGSAIEALKQCAVDLGVRERLLLLPPVPQTELMSYTKDADIGIIPLLGVKSHPYACPGKLFEYIGAELPIVVSDMPNLKLLVEKYGLGEVYPADSVECLTEALARLLKNDSYRKQCAGNARKGQLEDLCWEKQSAKLCEIVLGRKTPICAPSLA